MEFRLVYEGRLIANGNAAEKQRIRRVFHRQLSALWQQRPLRDHARYLTLTPPPGDVSLVFPLPGSAFQFSTVVSERVNLVCDMNILFLRREEPGKVITQGGDIDNRLKTLFDALRLPKNLDELPKGDAPHGDEAPFFFCLLEDDALITRVSVTVDRLLVPGDASSVLLILDVVTRPTVVTWGNISLGD